MRQDQKIVFEKSPILLICFNRLDFVKKQLENLPKDRRVYILQDGLGQKLKFRAEWSELREYLRSHCLDVPHYNVHLRDDNLGGADGIPAAVDWVLKTEDAIIVLEDDCFPGDAFYKYADFMLTTELDQKICFITGNNFLPPKHQKNENSIISYPHCWGWAITKQKWITIRPHRDKNHHWLSKYGETQIKRKMNIMMCVWRKQHLNLLEKLYWYFIFERVITLKKYHWDYTVQLNMWVNDFYCVMPCVNLVKNTGADDRSLNVKHKTANHFLSTDVSQDQMAYLLKAPTLKEYDIFIDKIDQKAVFGSWTRMVYHRLGFLKESIRFIYFSIKTKFNRKSKIIDSERKASSK